MILQVGSHLYYKDKFRFEHFKTTEELILYIRANFPEGSDSFELVKVLKDAGAKCNKIKEDDDDPKRDIGNPSYQCIYNTGWLSYPPLTNYSLIIYKNQHERITSFYARRQYGGP